MEERIQVGSAADVMSHCIFSYFRIFTPHYCWKCGTREAPDFKFQSHQVDIQERMKLAAKRELTMSRDQNVRISIENSKSDTVQAEGRKIIVVGTMNTVFLNGEIELWG